MASFEGESPKVIDKFNGENFNLWKFKMEMVLASMDLWEIVNRSEEAPPSEANPKAIKEYQRRAKKAMSTIGINLVDSQLHHIKRCKGTHGGMEDTLQHPQDAELVQHPLHSPQVLHVQDVRGRGPSRPHQQGQGACRSTCLLRGAREE
jgi:hypothetical protein